MVLRNTEDTREVVLTYRQEPEEQVFELSRPLPERMLARPEEGPVPPPPKARKRRTVVGLSLLALLIALGVGIHFLQQRTPAPQTPAGQESAGQESPGQKGEQLPPPYEDYWILEEETPGETTINTYRPSGDSAARLTLTSAGEDAAELTPGQVYSTVSPAVVTVISEDNGAYGVGTGVIFSEDGYIVTNYHVIDGASACRVWITDSYGVDDEYEALLVGGDADQDLAVLKIEGEDLPTAEFGLSDELAVGDKVYAIGHPLGLELRCTFTDGIVSAVDRDVDMGDVTMTLLQTNTALNHGNSGGPLINRFGQVVGINTIKMMSKGDTIEGLGFAIPTSIAVHWINEIIETGEIGPQPLLGVSLLRVPTTLPDGTTGLEVAEVVPGQGAEKAGLLVGDYMVSFNGHDVVSVDHVLRLRRGLRVGDLVDVRIWRDGEYLDMVIEMTSK